MDNDFKSAEIFLRLSWEAHKQAFGPILEPAFEDAPQVRIMLTNTLNDISNREIRRGMEGLKKIRQFCTCDDDLAAWTFFVGLCFEMAGDKPHMMEWYEKSEKFGHRFFLPYMKLAKSFRDTANHEKAAYYYALSVECLLEMPENDRDIAVLGAAYVNLASCLTSLHRFGEAEKAWLSAQQYPLPHESDATAAILYAYLGDEKKACEYAQRLKESSPLLADNIRETVRLILKGVTEK